MCIFWGKQETVFNIKNIELDEKSSFHRIKRSIGISRNTREFLLAFWATVHSNMKASTQTKYFAHLKMKRKKLNREIYAELLSTVLRIAFSFLSFNTNSTKCIKQCFFYSSARQRKWVRFDKNTITVCLSGKSLI